MAEQRYEAVRAVIADGETVMGVAARFGVSRKTVHGWLARYEAGGLEGLADRSHRPRFELGRRGVAPAVSESAAYRALARLNLVDPAARRPRDRKWKRWERGTPMELWQLDVVGGFLLADGTRAKALTGVDDHSRFCVSARLMVRESSRAVCDALSAALRAYGCPEQILTDNGKVFTGRFNHPPVEVLFDRICRENGIGHLLTQPRSPTTTGKIERFHRAIRTEFRTDRMFPSLAAAQTELDEWVEQYNTRRPHQALDMATPAERFWRPTTAAVTALRPATDAARPGDDRSDGTWIARRASAVGVVCVNWQQVCLGAATAGRSIDVWVTDDVMQFYDGDQLLRTQQREHRGEVRKKRASIPGGRPTLKTSVTKQPK